MTNWIGIALGDASGIGPEITLKALATEREEEPTRFLLLGDYDHLQRLNEHLQLHLPLQRCDGPEVEGRFFVYNPFPDSLAATLEPGSPMAARAALAWLKDGAIRCMRQELDALVTAPVNKASIVRAGNPFIGQTEYLSQLAGTDRTAMMLLGEDGQGRCLRVSLATTHLPLRMVPDQLTQEKIERVIGLTVQACHDLQLAQCRIGVCGLNPHAGEEGELGWEDQQIIAPAVQAASLRHAEVTGPLAADTLFYQAYCGQYDAVVAMYHDQGLVPLKMIGFRTGVNWTLGLPFIRTSPDHGTAYSLVGRNKADPSSMQSAIRLAKQLARTRAEVVPDLRVG